MKTIIAACICLLCVCVFGQGAKLDQLKPLNKRPGGSVKLKKVLRISDDFTNFYFRYPHNMALDQYGDVYVMDYNQFLRFDKGGKFLHNFYQRGQGPGELVTMKNYLLFKDHIIILNVRPHKILWFKKDGFYVREFRIRKNFFTGKLLTYRNGKYYVVTSGIPKIKGEKSFTYDLFRIYELSEDDGNFKQLAAFPVKTFVVNLGGGRASKDLANFFSRVYKDRYVVISHSREYQVKIFDLEKAQIIRVFSRKYSRIKKNSSSDDDVIINLKRYKELEMEYEEDIEDIALFGDEIWVVTSTKKKEQTLIDVFDHDGYYLDNFYLKLNGTIMASDGKHILVREKDRNENPIIVKYLVKR